MKNTNMSTAEEMKNYLIQVLPGADQKLAQFTEHYEDVLARHEPGNFKHHVDIAYNELTRDVPELRTALEAIKASSFPSRPQQETCEKIEKNLNKLKTYCTKMAKYHKANAARDYETIQEYYREFDEYHADYLARRERIEACLATGDGAGAAQEMLKIDRYGGGAILDLGADSQYHPRDPKYRKIADQYNALNAWKDETRQQRISAADWQNGIIALCTADMMACKKALLALNTQLAARIEAEVVPGAQLDFAWYESVRELHVEYNRQLSELHDNARNIDTATTRLRELETKGKESPERGD